MVGDHALTICVIVDITIATPFCPEKTAQCSTQTASFLTGGIYGTGRKNSEKNNQNLMQLIRRAHGLVENPDLEKHRQSQDHIGELFGNSKEIQYRPVDIEGMDAEWVSVNRAHMKKYVILHCHGGGYSTGSSIYART